MVFVFYLNSLPLSNILRKKMKKEIKEILKILRDAIDAETKAFIGYYNASKRVSIPELKGILLSLAEEERKHKILLLNEYNTLKEQGYSRIKDKPVLKKHEIRYKIPQDYRLKKLETLSEIDLSGISLPTEIIGGDYLDSFSIIDESKGINVLGIILFDAMGHGISATYIKSQTREIFQKLREDYYKKNKSIDIFCPSNVVTEINKSIADKCQKDSSFVTMFCCLIDMNKKELLYTSAGHEPPIYISKDKDNSELFGTTQLLLGFEKTFTYEEVKIKINKGDIVVLFTDGIVEAHNEKGKMLERKKIIDTVLEHNNRPSSVILDSMLHTLNNHIGNKFLDDEMSLLIAKIK